MTFQEVLTALRTTDEPLDNSAREISLAMAEQIEANRLAIEELRKEELAHWPAWRSPSDA